MPSPDRLAPTRAIRSGVSLANVGYALPGSVLAVSIMLAFSYLDRELVVPLSGWLGGAGKPLLLGSLSALLLAYLVRFLAVAYGPLENSLARIRPSLPEAARSLGVSGPRLFFKVYLPLLLPGTLSAALLVFVDVLKEMPATLLMRPFGWDTLAVRIFEMTSEGEWARASLPALTLVLVGPATGHRTDPTLGPSKQLGVSPDILRLQCAAFGAVRLTDQVAEIGWKPFISRLSLTSDSLYRAFATPGRRNPWDSVRLCMTCISPSARRWSILAVGICLCITARRSRSTTRCVAIAGCSMFPT